MMRSSWAVFTMRKDSPSHVFTFYDAGPACTEAFYRGPRILCSARGDVQRRHCSTQFEGREASVRRMEAQLATFRSPPSFSTCDVSSSSRLISILQPSVSLQFLYSSSWLHSLMNNSLLLCVLCKSFTKNCLMKPLSACALFLIYCIPVMKPLAVCASFVMCAKFRDENHCSLL